VNTKCARYGPTSFDFRGETVKKTVEESIKRLKVTYLDTITVHDVEFAEDIDQVISETVPALRELQKAGRVRYVGISGYPLNVLLYIAKRVPLDFVLTYCHYNLQNSMLEEYIDKFQSCGCGVINASPLCMGILTQKGPAPFHPAVQGLKDTVKQAVNLCENKNVDIANLAIQWATHSELAQSGAITTTLLGMCSAAEVEANINCVNQKFNNELLQKVLQIVKPYHNYTWPSGNSKWSNIK